MLFVTPPRTRTSGAARARAHAAPPLLRMIALLLAGPALLPGCIINLDGGSPGSSSGSGSGQGSGSNGMDDMPTAPNGDCPMPP
jgi:hypothetical protein